MQQWVVNVYGNGAFSDSPPQLKAQFTVWAKTRSEAERVAYALHDVGYHKTLEIEPVTGPTVVNNVPPLAPDLDK